MTISSEKFIEVLSEKGSAVCRLPGEKGWGIFSKPIDHFCIFNFNDIKDVIEKISTYARSGKFAAGYISYEASPAFDSAHKVKGTDFPLIEFYVYDSVGIIDKLPKQCLQSDTSAPESELDKSSYIENITRIKNYIESGDIYQANYTFRTETEEIKYPVETFLHLTTSHPVPYSAFINCENHKIISISPELFIEKTGSNITSSPMKGTASRSPLPSVDEHIAAALKSDPKNCAENVMIVDMVRNDLGKVCEPGSISVDPLFHVDTYQTVHQMISSVHGKVKPDASNWDILSATFPAASITGAPKIRSMEIIEELEISPRKVYTGSIGCFTPEGNLCFNIAIRTLICNGSKTELGIGSGVVADSVAESEWNESLLKSTFMSRSVPDFKILETILWTEEEGYILLEEHLERAKTSQDYFSRPWNLEEVKAALASQSFDNITKARVRLLIDYDGTPELEVYPLTTSGWGKDVVKVKVSDEATSSKNPYLYHKTTNRDLYNTSFRQATREGFNEVIFFNEKGELTEGAISNIFIKQNGNWLTPALECGLLCGIWRNKLTKELNAKETVISRDELSKAEEIIICNSVRGAVKAEV